MNKLKSLLKSFWAYDGVKRTVHTFWQVAGGVLLAQLLVARSAKDVYAAVILAGAAGLAAVKAVLVSRG